MAWTGLHTFILVTVGLCVGMGIFSAVRAGQWQRRAPSRRINKGIAMMALNRIPVIQYDPEMGGQLPFVAPRAVVPRWRRVLGRVLCWTSHPTANEEELPAQAPLPPSPSLVSLPPSPTSPSSPSPPSSPSSPSSPSMVPLPPSPTLPSVEGCAICMDDFARGTDVRRLPCGHLFHPPCVDPWLLRIASTCPTW